MAALEKRTTYEPNNPVAYHYMATFYQDKIEKHIQLSGEQKRLYAIKGIAAEDKALALNPNYTDAIVYKNILLRQQARFERDPAVQKRLINEAEILYKKAIEMRKAANGAGK